jgi:hypothetical protein
MRKIKMRTPRLRTAQKSSRALASIAQTWACLCPVCTASRHGPSHLDGLRRHRHAHNFARALRVGDHELRAASALPHSERLRCVLERVRQRYQQFIHAHAVVGAVRLRPAAGRGRGGIVRLRVGVAHPVIRR